MNLSGQLKALPANHVLGCWSGIVSSGQHPYVRADLLRLFCFTRKGWAVRHMCLCPYRPAAFECNLMLSDQSLAHCLQFERKSTFIIREGGRRGRLARPGDLRLDDVGEEQTVDVLFDIADGRCPRDGLHSLQRAERLFAAAAVIGKPIKDHVVVPALHLSIRNGAVNLMPRSGCPEPTPVDHYSDVDIYDAEQCYGQGVWCVDPSELGVWFQCPVEEMEVRSNSLFISLEDCDAAQ